MAVVEANRQEEIEALVKAPGAARTCPSDVQLSSSKYVQSASCGRDDNG